MKILVTGGTGFIGRRLCLALLEQGADVTSVDRNSPKSVHPVLSFANFHPVIQDVQEYFETARESFDKVFHLAGPVFARHFFAQNPGMAVDQLCIDAAFWKWVLRVKPGRTIYLSSSAVYALSSQAETGHHLLRESEIDWGSQIGIPDQTYGWAKLTGEFLIQKCVQDLGIPGVCFRPFSVYGEDQHPEFPFASLCRRAISSRNANEFHVWGSGSQMRDFIHVDDCVTGLLRLHDQVSDGSAINLSTGILTSFRSLAGMICEALGYRPNVFGLVDRPSGVFARGGDTGRQQSLGFAPQIDLRTGIQRCLDHLNSGGEAHFKGAA